MPPPRGTSNILEGPGDYDVTSIVHNDTYLEIDPTKADFSGKAVFVTGGSRGLGRAIVLSFAKAGASFIAAAARSDMSQLARDVQDAAASANRSPPKFLPVQLDISNPQSAADAAAAVEKEFGRCDVVVNNAGIIGRLELIGDSDPSIWGEVLDVNIRGTYLVSRAFLPLLQKTDNAYLVNIASVGGHLVTPTASAYQISKLAVIRLSQFLNTEYAAKGVTAFSIHPGNCATDMVGGSEGINPDLKHIFVDTPELNADTIVFLTSQKRDWIGGRYINVTWDMPQLMAKEDEIVKGDKLKLRLDF